MTAPAPPPRIEPATADDAAAVFAGLRAFNDAACGSALDDQPLHRVIRDAQGQPCAGLVADVYGGWLMVHALWVDASQRGRRLGQTLLADAEQQALAMGAHSAMLDTFSWQAEASTSSRAMRSSGGWRTSRPGITEATCASG